MRRLVCLALLGVLGCQDAPVIHAALPPATTFADYGDQVVAALVQDLWADGQWHACDGGCARGMCRSDHCAQIVGVLDAVQNHMKAALGRSLLDAGILVGRTVSDHTLVARAACATVELFARLKPDRNVPFAAKLN